MKHYTNTELTGLSAKETKLKNVLCKLYTYWLIHKQTELLKEEKLGVLINRYELNMEVQGGLDENYPVSRHTISSWITTLLNKGFLVQNPTSHIQGGKIAPSLNTRYFINGNSVEETWEELLKRNKFLREKVDTHTCLDQFTNEINQPNSEVQEEIKSKL
jgi:hypothetical protein